MAIRIPQVRESALPSTTGIRTPNEDAFGAGIGKANEGLGAQLGNIGLTLQNEANEAKAREVDTFYTRRANDLKNGYAQQNGKVAYESQQDYDTALADLKREALDMLENDAQRGMLGPIMDRKETEALQFGSQHAIKSLKDWQIGELTAQAALNTEEAVANFGTEKGSIAIASMMENIEDLGDKNGWAPDVVEMEKSKAMSGVIKARVTQLLAEDPYAAEALYTQAAETGELSATDAAGLANRVQGELDKQLALDLTDKFIADTGGDYQAAYEMAKQIPDRDQRLEVQRLIKNDMAMKETFEREAKKDLHQAEWNKLYQIENPTLRDLPAPGTVDPDVRSSMETYIDRKISRDRNVHNDDQLANDLQNMWADDPKAFGEVDLNKYRERLDPNTMLRLEKLQQGDEKEVRVHTTKTELYKRGETAAGIGKANKEGSAQFRNSLDAALERATEDKGKPLTSSEQQEVLNREVYQYKQKLFREGTGFGGFFRDDITLDEAFSSAEFKAADGTVWPEDLVTDVIKQMDEAGQDLSVENVQRQLDKLESKYRQR